MSYKQEIKEIFKFNRRFIKEDITEDERNLWLQRFTMYTIDELTEILEELPFKHWKDYTDTEVDKEAILNEIADVLIFTFGMVDILGYDEDDILNEIAEKNQVNIKRQEEGY